MLRCSLESDSHRQTSTGFGGALNGTATEAGTIVYGDAFSGKATEDIAPVFGKDCTRAFTTIWEAESVCGRGLGGSRFGRGSGQGEVDGAAGSTLDCASSASSTIKDSTVLDRRRMLNSEADPRLSTLPRLSHSLKRVLPTASAAVL